MGVIPSIESGGSAKGIFCKIEQGDLSGMRRRISRYREANRCKDIKGVGSLKWMQGQVLNVPSSD